MNFLDIIKSSVLNVVNSIKFVETYIGEVVEEEELKIKLDEKLFVTEEQIIRTSNFNEPINADTTIYAKISKVETNVPENVVSGNENNNAEKDETPKTGIPSYLGLAAVVIIFSTSIIISMKKKDIKG